MTDARFMAEPMPGTEETVETQFARCAHCSQTIVRVEESNWVHRGSGRMVCKQAYINLSDIRAERGKGND